MNPATPPTAWEARTDLLVVGGGVAGLTAARTAAAAGAQVLVAVKDPATGTATSFAQGGIAAVDPQWQARGDSVAAHAADTRHISTRVHRLHARAHARTREER